MATTLNKLQPNEKGIVTNISGDKPIRRRLIDMGITPGIEVKMKKAAPFGDPIEITIRGYELSIRKQEAAEVSIIQN